VGRFECRAGSVEQGGQEILEKQMEERERGSRRNEVGAERRLFFICGAANRFLGTAWSMECGERIRERGGGDLKFEIGEGVG